MLFRSSLILVLLTSAASILAQEYKRLDIPFNKDSVENTKARIKAIPVGLFEEHAYERKGGSTIPFRLLPPSHITHGKKYPLVLVFHSSGTPIGHDNISQVGILAKLWAKPDIREKYPAFILAPQFPKRSSNYILDSVSHMLVSSPDPCLLSVLELVDSLKKALPIDERRVYVTGFSMGGSTTINAMELRPDLFAAGIAISGIPSRKNTYALRRTPILLVHGDADTENPISADSAFYKSFHDRARISFWQIKGLEHEIYPGLYMSDMIPRWLFASLNSPSRHHR